MGFVCEGEMSWIKPWIVYIRVYASVSSTSSRAMLESLRVVLAALFSLSVGLQSKVDMLLTVINIL